MSTKSTETKEVSSKLSQFAADAPLSTPLVGPIFDLLNRTNDRNGQWLRILPSYIHPNTPGKGVVCISATLGIENYYIEFGWTRQGDPVVKVWKNVHTDGVVPSTFFGRIDLRAESMFLDLSK